MLIGMPVESNQTDTLLSPSFGRAAFFMIYDDESKQIKYLNNQATAQQGGAGIQAAQAIVDAGARVIITCHCGENAAKVLAAGNVTIYRANGMNVSDNLAALSAGQLPLLTDIHPGLHNHG